MYSTIYFVAYADTFPFAVSVGVNVPLIVALLRTKFALSKLAITLVLVKYKLLPSDKLAVVKLLKVNTVFATLAVNAILAILEFAAKNAVLATREL